MTEDEAEVPLNRFGFQIDAEEADGLVELEGARRKKALAKLRSREIKWRNMLQEWPKYSTTNKKKLRERVRKGIPNSLRGIVWRHLLLGMEEVTPVPSKDLIALRTLKPSATDPLSEYFGIIDNDLHRTFPKHELFDVRDGLGQSELRDLLRLYAFEHPTPGYCQGTPPP